MPTLPAYVKLLFEGFGEQRESALLRTEMESGPPKQPKVRSRVMVTRTVALGFDTKADYLAFVAWFADDLKEGSDWFDFTDPVSETVKQGRFVGGGLEARPLQSALSHWTIKLRLESWGN